MEYVVGLFEDCVEAEQAVELLRAAGVRCAEYTIRNRDYTVRDRLERPFGMEEPQAHVEAHGLTRESSEWLDRRLDRGRVTVEILLGDGADRPQKALVAAGTTHVRRFRWWPTPKTGVSK